jgi:hypothetical protein
MPPSIPNPSSADLSHSDPSITPKKNNLSSSRTSISRTKGNRTTKRVPKSKPVHKQAQEEEVTTTTQPLGASSTNNALSPYNSTGMMPYGMSPMMGGGMSPMMGGGMSPMMGPISNLNQFLYGIQTVVFSLSQAIQLLGMNQEALQQAFDSLTSMMDHAVATFHELRALEAMQNEQETEEQKKRRQRLKTIRWALMMGGSYVVYKLIRRITSRRKQVTYTGNNSAPLSAGYGLSGPSMYGNGSYGGPGMQGGYNPTSAFGPSMYGGGNYYGSGSGGYF